MKRHATATHDDLADRNAAHIPCYWMLLTPDEAHELAHGRIPDLVRRLAQWLAEDHPPLTEEA